MFYSRSLLEDRPDTVGQDTDSEFSGLIEVPPTGDRRGGDEEPVPFHSVVTTPYTETRIGRGS